MTTFNVENVKFNIIAAIDRNLGIGKNNQLPWYFSNELKYFKRVTSKTLDKDKINAVIMGRKTWDSLPLKPLPNRKNIVISKQKLNLPSNALRAGDLFAGIWLASLFRQEIENIFVIGGASIYNQAIKLKGCNRLYITEINKNYDCDAFFPEFRNDFQLKRLLNPNINKEYNHFLYEILKENQDDLSLG